MRLSLSFRGYFPARTCVGVFISLALSLSFPLSKEDVDVRTFF